jgi:hypothetical protein
MTAINSGRTYDKKQAYRRRIAAAGEREVLVQLPEETIRFLDGLKDGRGLKNRSEALQLLINHGRTVTRLAN